MFQWPHSIARRGAESAPMVPHRPEGRLTPWRWIAAFVAAAILAGACSGAVSSAPTLAPTQTATPAPAVTPHPATAVATAAAPPRQVGAPAPTVAPELLAALKQIEERVIGLRGLTAGREPARQFVTQEELRHLLLEKIEGHTEELAIQQEILTLLGLLEEGQDLKALQIDLLTDQVLGLFDLDTGDILLISATADLGPLNEFTYAHEFTHALQQARFDLAARHKLLKDDSEAQAAFDALVEGDATLLQTQYLRFMDVRELQQAIQRQGEDSLQRFPFVLRELIQFPYQEGLAFVTNLFRGGGWRAVDAAYASPPTTTEQIIHPERYRAGEGALPVELPDLAAELGPEWTKRKTDSLGEFGLRVLLDAAIPRDEARRAAAGWGGDRLALLSGPAGARLLFGLVRWDTAKDAGEFAEAYAKLLRNRGAGVSQDGQGMAGSVGRYRHVLRRQADQTLLIIASDPTLPERVLARFPAFRS